jgi:hypothetical protein
VRIDTDTDTDTDTVHSFKIQKANSKEFMTFNFIFENEAFQFHHFELLETNNMKSKQT